MKAAKHLVHGEWMTRQECADRLGVSYSAVRDYQLYHRQPDGKPGLLVTAYDHYRAVADGQVKRYPGRQPKRHRIHGRLMTTRQACEAAGVDVQSVWVMIHRRGLSVEAAVDRCEQLAKRRAEREILRIIYGG